MRAFGAETARQRRAAAQPWPAALLPLRAPRPDALRMQPAGLRLWPRPRPLRPEGFAEGQVRWEALLGPEGLRQAGAQGEAIFATAAQQGFILPRSALLQSLQVGGVT